MASAFFVFQWSKKGAISTKTGCLGTFSPVRFATNKNHYMENVKEFKLVVGMEGSQKFEQEVNNGFLEISG